MHGCGNDYIYIDCREKMPDFDIAALAVEMSKRRFSVGSDGIILICSSDIADAKMRIFNLDGSEGKMCGNGIRCVGKYIFDNGERKQKQLRIETLSGIKTLDIIPGKNGLCERVGVGMGKVCFDAECVPVRGGKRLISSPLEIGGNIYNVTALSVGNPHCVLFVEDTDNAPVNTLGPVFEHDENFPEGVNTEFVLVESPNKLKMRVWERGSNETFACGTGATAAAAAAVANGFCHFDEPIEVTLLGGTLVISIDKDFNASMTGEAVKVYEGVYEYDSAEC